MRFVRAILFSVFVTSIGIAVIWLLNQGSSQEYQGRQFIQESRAAKALAAGHSIVFPYGISESVLRWSLAETIPTISEIVLLGSSHGQQISTDFLPGHSFLNLCAAGGMFTDDLISSQILIAGQKRPRTWLIVMDPWLFDADADYLTWQARPQTLAQIDESLAALQAPPLRRVFQKRIEALRTAQEKTVYQLDPLLHRFDEFARQLFDRPTIADGRNYKARLIHSDGSIQRKTDAEFSNADAQVLALRQFSEKSDRLRYGNYARLDPDLINVFESWIRFLQSDGAHVILILTPYHPAIFSKIVANPENRLRAVEAWVREHTEVLHFDVVGSYDPTNAGVTSADFFDGDHLQETGLRKLLSTVPPLLVRDTPR